MDGHETLPGLYNEYKRLTVFEKIWCFNEKPKPVFIKTFKEEEVNDEFFGALWQKTSNYTSEVKDKY